MCIKDQHGKAMDCDIYNDSTDQKWYIQRSGGGYLLKNCQSGRYLAAQVINTTSASVEPVCGIQPTRWEISQRSSGSMLIRLVPPGERGYFLALSSSSNDCMPRTAYSGGSTATTSRDWKLRRLSDDIGEADSRTEELVLTTLDAGVQTEDEKKIANAIDRALMEKDKLIADKDHQLGEITSRLLTQGKDLAQARLELAEGANRLVTQHQELAQIRLELVEARSRLVETQDVLRQSEERLASRDAQLSRIKEQLNGSDAEDSLTRQKEMDEMRTRMQAIEQFMSSQNQRFNNAA
ncbi:hypothetical protein FRC12_008594 [Ceratobasidium sp. 428]|nr:hypothetical protein FRC12_008594 [Ceratobasidium sp. 428]